MERKNHKHAEKFHLFVFYLRFFRLMQYRSPMYVPPFFPAKLFSMSQNIYLMTSLRVKHVTHVNFTAILKVVVPLLFYEL
jgi:hypothetical protein